MGIVAISMLSMLMLMPVGLAGMRASTTETVRAQIMQRMTTQAMLVGFSSLTTWANNQGNPFFFDDQGRLQGTDSATGFTPQIAQDKDTRYSVVVAPPTGPVYPGTALMPGATTPLAKSVATVKMTITLLKSATQPVSFVILVPNQG